MALVAASALAAAPVQRQRQRQHPHAHAPRFDRGDAFQPYTRFLTIYPNLGHDSWNPVYDEPVVYLWLLEQRQSANNKDRR